MGKAATLVVAGLLSAAGVGEVLESRVGRAAPAAVSAGATATVVPIETGGSGRAGDPEDMHWIITPGSIHLVTCPDDMHWCPKIPYW
jgi:hypothetical protein